MKKLFLVLISGLALGFYGCGGDSRGDFFGGPSMNGLRLHIDVLPKQGGKHVVQPVFQNISDKGIKIWESGFWPNTFLQCFDDSGAIPEFTDEGRRILEGFSPGGERTKNYLVPIAPMQKYDADRVFLETVYKLKQSQFYKIRVIYEERHDGGWTGSITSNVVRIQY